MDLALDTSSAISVAVLDGDRVAARATEYAPRSHSEILAPMIRRVLDEAEARGRVGRIVVGTGPAPFTGLRVGLATAEALGIAWQVPVLGCCSLDALGVEAGGQATAVLDARRREVYWASYEDGVRVDGPAVGFPQDVRVLGTVVGRGAAIHSDVFGSHEPAFLDPDPAWLARAVSRLEAAGEIRFETRPLYLRRPDARPRTGP